jgi:hypothetical protein
VAEWAAVVGAEWAAAEWAVEWVAAECVVAIERLVGA